MVQTAYTLAATVPPGFTAYSWYNESEHKSLTGSGSTLKIPYGSSDYPYGNSDISLKAADSSGCALKDLVFVTVSPSLTVDYAKDTICYGEDDYEKMQITVKGAEAVKTIQSVGHPLNGIYNWAPSDSVTFVRSGQSGEIRTTKIKMTKTFTVTGTIDTSADAVYCIGDTSEISFTINVKGPFPVVTATPSSTAILKGCSIKLVASDDQSSALYTWAPGNGLNKVIGDTVVASPEETTTYYVTSQNTNDNSYGCCGSDKILVRVYDAGSLCTNCGNTPVFCPDIFSPKTLTAPSVSGFSYQWQRRLPCDTFKNITGATGNTYTVSSWNGSYGSLCATGTSEFPYSNSYRVKVMGTNGCSQYSKVQRFYSYNAPYSCRLEQPLELEKGSAKDDLMVYPNPTEGLFIVEVNNNEAEQANLIVYDMMGKTVLKRNIVLSAGANQLQIQFADYMPDGIYRVAIRTGHKQLSSSIIKTRF